MRYTLLRVSGGGVVLWDHHLRRLGLGPGSAALDQLQAFAREAPPGVYAVRTDGERTLQVERRARGSLLRDGMPARLLPSPLAGCSGPIAKPAPPGPYAPLRLEGTTTLLTSPDAGEVYEACSAAVLAWDGGLLCAPRDRPRVWSTAEAAVREALQVHEAPISPALPLLLVNAVRGTCAPRGAAFPLEIRRQIDELLDASARRP